MSDHRDIKTSTLFRVGFLTIAIVAVLTLAMMVLYQRMANRLEYERTTSRPNPDVERMVEEQRRQLNEYGVAGTEKVGEQSRTIYRIPIEVAMEKVLHDWQEGIEPREPSIDRDSDSAKDAGHASAEPSAGLKPPSGETPEEKYDERPES